MVESNPLVLFVQSLKNNCGPIPSAEKCRVDDSQSYTASATNYGIGRVHSHNHVRRITAEALSTSETCGL